MYYAYYISNANRGIEPNWPACKAHIDNQPGAKYKKFEQLSDAEFFSRARDGPTPVQPISVQPISVQPTPVQPISVQPTPIQPTPVQPISVQPISVQPISVQPISVQPISVQPISVQPTIISMYVPIGSQVTYNNLTGLISITCLSSTPFAKAVTSYTQPIPVDNAAMMKDLSLIDM